MPLAKLGWLPQKSLLAYEGIVDKYFHKREKVANLLFDLVKYLLTALGATLLFTDKEISTGIILIIAALALLVFVMGIFINPRKED